MEVTVLSSGSSQSILGPYLGLFASAEIFIFVFIEIVTKIKPIERVLIKKAEILDYAIFIVLFGMFSIFGTSIGITHDDASISNIRDIAPMVAGMAAGPYAGLAVGLIGGTERLFLGGASAVPCSLATVLAGLISGMVYLLCRKRLPGIVVSMLIACCIELLHGALIILMVQPFPLALSIFLENIPQMVIANALGVGICIIVIHNRIETYELLHHEEPPEERIHPFIRDRP